MLRILTLPVLLALAGPAHATAQPAPASPDVEAILAVVDGFMTAISTNDAVLMAKVRLEGTTNTVERPAATGGSLVTRRPFTPDSRPGSYRERYWDPVVHVRGRIAVVWTPYEFWQNGKTSHCGVDVFELVKEEAGWRIGNAMWTVEPDACPALRPSDPSRVRPKDQPAR